MAHYAFLDDNDFVVQVIPGKDEGEGTDWEQEYAAVDGRECKRTSYNTYHNAHKNGGTPFRGNYAGKGYKYDRVNDVFIPPKPFPSWTLDTSIWDYVAPKTKPTLEQCTIDEDNIKVIAWNEGNQRWQDVQSEDYWDSDTSSWVTP